MNRTDSLRYLERIREDRENRMVALRIEADRLAREREQAHAAILSILNDDAGWEMMLDKVIRESHSCEVTP